MEEKIRKWKSWMSDWKAWFDSSSQNITNILLIWQCGLCSCTERITHYLHYSWLVYRSFGEVEFSLSHSVYNIYCAICSSLDFHTNIDAVFVTNQYWLWKKYNTRHTLWTQIGNLSHGNIPSSHEKTKETATRLVFLTF